MIRRVWQLAPLVLAFATESHAAGTVPSPPSFAISYSGNTALVTVGRCYPTGIRVLAEHDPRQPLVAVTMMVGDGSGADPEGMGGLAHLAEHLWFRARPGGGPSIEDRLAAMGATTNAYTMQDVVMFETVVPRDHLEDVLKLEALRFGLDRGAWTEDMLTTERQIIAQEMRDRGARTLMVDAVRDQLFPAPHPYSAVGDQGLDAVTLDEVARWWAEQSRPDNATLVVRGDWPPYEVHALAATVLPLADDTARPCAVRNEAVVTLPEPAPVERHDPRPAPVDSRAVLIAWSLPPAFRDDDWAMRGAAQRLENQIVSQLSMNFNWAAARRMRPTCEWWPGARGSTLTCIVPLFFGQRARDWFRLATAELEETMSGTSVAIIEEYQAWSTQLARYDEIGHAVRSRGVLSTLEPSVGDLVFDSALLAHFAGAPDPVDRRIHAALRGSADVSAIMRTYVTRERGVWVELVPQQGEEAMPALDSLALNPAAPPTDNFGSTATLAAPRLGKVRDFRLDNGLRVIAVPFGEAPIVHVALVDGGPSLGASADWTHMSFDDAADVPNVDAQYGLSGATIAARKMGSSLDRRFVDGRPTHALESSSENFADALYLVRFAGPESRLATNRVRAWNKEVRKQKPGPAATASYRGLEALIGSAAAKNVLGFATTVDQDALVRQHQQWHRPETSTLYVVGKIPDDVAQQVRRAFGGWTAPAIEERDAFSPPIVLPDLPAASTVVVDGEGRASVSLACRLPQYSLAERYVLQHAVRDATYREARERQALVYTPSVGALDLGADVPATLLVVAGSTDAATAGELLEALETSLAPTASGWWERARGEASVERSLELHGLAGLTEALVDGEVRLDGTVHWEIDDSRADAIRADLETCRATRFALVTGPRGAVQESLDKVGMAVTVAE